MQKNNARIFGSRVFIFLILATLFFSACNGTKAIDSPPAVDPVVNPVDRGTTDTGTTTTPDTVVTFALTGKNFVFVIDGQENPELRVKQGDTVTIELAVTEGFHDWVVDEFAAKTQQVKSGGTTSVTFVADKQGTFEYYCSIGSHRQQGMKGTLIVE
jgi:plastocyanin